MTQRCNLSYGHGYARWVDKKKSKSQATGHRVIPSVLPIRKQLLLKRAARTPPGLRKDTMTYRLHKMRSAILLVALTSWYVGLWKLTQTAFDQWKKHGCRSFENISETENLCFHSLGSCVFFSNAYRNYVVFSVSLRLKVFNNLFLGEFCDKVTHPTEN